MQRAAELLDLGGHHVHADAATRVLREAAGGRKAGLEHQLHRIVVGDRLALADQAELEALAPDRGEIHAGAVVGDLDDHLGALAMQAHRDAAGLGLVVGEALRRRLDAVHHRIAQHVLERRQHALEHLPVELARGALDHQFGALAGVGRRLAHDARQALHVALERHHAGAHQAVLQLGDVRACCCSRFCVFWVCISSSCWMLPTSLAVSASARENCWIDE